MSLRASPLNEVEQETQEISSSLSTDDTTRLQHPVGSYEREEVTKATDWQSWAMYTGLLKTRGWTDYMVFDFEGSLDIVRLEASCKSLLSHFGILRTVFIVDQRRLLQVVLKDYPLEFKNHRLTSNVDIRTVSKHIFDEDAASTTILGQPLVRFTLISSSGAQRLLLRISHAQYDVVSLACLFRTLKDAYSGVELCPSPSFVSFINVTSRHDSVSEHFWRNLLKGSKMTQIIKETRPTYSNVVDTALKRNVALPAMQRQGITAASLALSAWAIALSQLAGTSDVVFGRLTSGRHSDMTGIQEIVGPCMNITPVRALTDASTTVLGFLQEVQAQHLASLSYENVGFRHIIERCTDWVPWTRFSSIVNHVHIEEGIEDSFTLCEGLRYAFDVYEPMHDKSDLWLQTKPTGNRMEVELRFSGKVVSKQLAEKALQLFCDVVEQAWLVVEKPLSALLESSSFRAQPSVSKNLQAIIEAAWSQVFVGVRETSAIETIGIDTPFYSLWGDLIAAAALCKHYREEGFEVFVEDIIDNPTMQDQIRLLGGKCI